jgi:hypothetical protein
MPKLSFCSPPPLAITKQDRDFADRTARYVCDFYESLGVRGSKPQTNQWTVISAFLSYKRPSSHELQGNLRILTFALGNKCVAAPSEREKQVVDMHAEILARRELELLLLDGIKVLESGHQLRYSSADSDSSAYETLESLVSSDAELFLYSSHMPCGSASNAAHLDRLDKEDTILRAIVEGGDGRVHDRPNSTFRHDRVVGSIPPLSKKPSRADARPTTCYSCSDKLSRYQILGMEGGRLARVFEEWNWTPLRLYGIIVGEDFHDGLGLKALFGGTIGADYRQEPSTSYSRTIHGASEVFAEQTEAVCARFHFTLRETVTKFRIYPTNHVFKYSRQAVIQSQSDLQRQAETARVLFESFSSSEQARIRSLPLAMIRELLVPTLSVQSFPLGVHWRDGQTVEILNSSGVLNGTCRDKQTGNLKQSSLSRVCRERMKEAFRLARGSASKGGQGRISVLKSMEHSGPWKDWHDNKSDM